MMRIICEQSLIAPKKTYRLMLCCYETPYLETFTMTTIEKSIPVLLGGD